jgi:hypothetical protein
LVGEGCSFVFSFNADGGDIVMETEIGHRGGQWRLGGEDVDWYRGEEGNNQCLGYTIYSLCSLAGRYDNPMPESTLSPQSGTMNLTTGQNSSI